MKSLLAKLAMTGVAVSMLSAVSFGQNYSHHRWSHNYWTHHRHYNHYRTYWRNDGAGYWGYHAGIRVWIPL